jgi:hypothetical protein
MKAFLAIAAGDVIDRPSGCKQDQAKHQILTQKGGGQLNRGRLT